MAGAGIPPLIVGMLREKAKATEFWDSADTIFTSVGKVEAGTEAAATVVGKASDTGTKAYHVLPHFFEVDLVIEIFPSLTRAEGSGGSKRHAGSAPVDHPPPPHRSKPPEVLGLRHP
ncbi:hypothetical protein KFL_012420010, partial [Klebsormidium nitens]